MLIFILEAGSRQGKGNVCLALVTTAGHIAFGMAYACKLVQQQDNAKLDLVDTSMLYAAAGLHHIEAFDLLISKKTASKTTI